MTNLPEPRDLFRGALTECITHNPDSIEYIVLLMAFYLHVGPFSREVIGRLENVMATLDAGTLCGPVLSRAGTPHPYR
jgi:hypothetical protein